MLIFIDDSGDPGFKLTKGSSSHFVITCVIFDDNLDAEEAALKIKRLRQTLGWHEKKAATTYFRREVSVVKEFKFVDSKSDNLIQLADMIAGTILRSAQNKPGSREYIQTIHPRIDDIWNFQ